MKLGAFALAATIVIFGTLAGYAFYFAQYRLQAGTGAGHSPIWNKAEWPFPSDIWGPGLAYHCKAVHCGREVRVYLRAKLGFCNCTTTIDDDMVDRISDIDLFASEREPLGSGREVSARSMKGRSRAYLVLGAEKTAIRSALSFAFHERCDLIVATAAIAGGQPELDERAVFEFLNSDVVRRWAEVTLGL
jgi:hypothetical protein